MPFRDRTPPRIAPDEAAAASRRRRPAIGEHRLRLLHLVHDEKFIPFVAETFERCAEVHNSFLVRVRDASAPLRYIGDLPNRKLAELEYLRSDAVREDLEACDCLIVHFMTGEGHRVLSKAPPRVAVVWSAWGADYYRFLSRKPDDLLDPATRRVVAHLAASSPPASWVDLAAHPMTTLREYRNARATATRTKETLRRVDFFSAPIPDDYDVLKHNLRGYLRAEYVQLNYASVERTFAPGTPNRLGGDILVGNSASATNNHVDVLSALAALDLGERKVICPLSYGEPDYRDAVARIGKSLLGDRFQALIDFMPLAEYNALVGNCGIVVMGHHRQQAVGTIGTMLYAGAKIFLSEGSTVYEFFKRNGAYVFGLDEIARNEPSLFTPLDDDEQSVNRQVLASFWSDDVVLRNVQQLVDAITRRSEQFASNQLFVEELAHPRAEQ